jgi:hypothetical protein
MRFTAKTQGRAFHVSITPFIAPGDAARVLAALPMRDGGRGARGAAGDAA